LVETLTASPSTLSPTSTVPESGFFEIEMMILLLIFVAPAHHSGIDSREGKFVFVIAGPQSGSKYCTVNGEIVQIRS
jgi:hypothetical protein